MRRFAPCVALLLTWSLAAGEALADAPPSAEVQREAGERFDRGLRLFNGGDNAGALAEFRRAYEIAPNSLVLYNLGLVYAQMGSAVEATDALDKVLADPGRLSAERVAIAQKTRDEQAARIAEVTVNVSVDGASVEVDGIEVGTTPLPRALRVTGGEHVVGAAAQGFAPKRTSILIASREKQTVRLDLVPMQGRIAHLMVKTHLPGAALFADDQRIGTTPVSVSVSLPPGIHRVELRRPGYVTAKTEVNLGDGATGEVALEPAEDPTEIAAIAGKLALAIDEPDSSIAIDGQSRGAYGEPLRLAPGPHHLVVLSPNFEPFEREVVVQSHATAEVRVHLVATPEYRVKFAGHARSRRAWSIVTAVAGVALAGAGVVLHVHDAKVESNANATLDVLPPQAPLRGTGVFCDPGGATGDLCQEAQNQASTNLSNAKALDYVAWSGVGVGAAALVVGSVLFFTTDSPHALDAPGADSASRAAGSVPRLPTLWAVRGGAGFGWSTSF